MKYKNKRLILCGIALLTCFILFLEPASAENRKRAAVLKFSANNTSRNNAEAAYEFFELELYKTNIFDILERGQIDTIIKERRLKRKNAAQIGKMLSADYVISGSLIKFDTYIVKIKLINSKDGRVILSASAEADTKRELRNAAKKLVKRISEKMNNKSQAQQGHGSSNFYFGIGAGYPFTTLDDKAGITYHHSDYTMDMKTDYKFSYSVDFGTSLTPYLKAGLNLNGYYLKQSGLITINEDIFAETFETDITKHINNIFAALYYFPTTEGIFLKAAGGFSSLSYTIEDETGSEQGSSSGPGFQAGLGYAFEIIDPLNFSVNADYTILYINGENISYFSLGCSIYFF